MKYWVPLLQMDGDNIKFTGQALPLPIDKRVVGKIKKEKINEGFQNPKLSEEWGLFCKLGHQRYLLGVNKLFTTPQIINQAIPLKSQIETKKQPSGYNSGWEEKENLLALLQEELKHKSFNISTPAASDKEGRLEERSFHEWKDLLDNKMSKKTEIKHRGVKIKLSGRLNGVNMAKSFQTTWGQIKPQSYNHLEYKLKHVRTPWGIFGLRVYLS